VDKDKEGALLSGRFSITPSAVPILARGSGAGLAALALMSVQADSALPLEAPVDPAATGQRA
jgi:hypothetical protein